ncbi:DUF1911 domain-containing protein [Terribacillus saccharophilus]|uniref:PoNi-like cognate immunity protein n=1 Tax=Terribacillus saccharophilus TaxID=361277 RepID=UPI0039829178
MKRDQLCLEDRCEKSIENKKKFIVRNRKHIKNIEEDIKNGIQRYPGDNKSIIERTYQTNFLYETDIIRAKYSIGKSVESIMDDFEEAITDLENMGQMKVGYLDLLWMVSLGILLETNKSNMERLSVLVQKYKTNDFVIDYLLTASNIEWNKITYMFEKENPYSVTKEIIEISQTDKTKASKRMQIYMDKEWFKGHYDYEWKNAHKEPGYVGFWSFETAALAKILKLDDSGLKDNNHYPYDLAHYKNTMDFKSFNLDDYLVQNASEAVENGREGIKNNPALEKIIPGKWHSFVDNLIKDYKELDDEIFFEKYKEPMELNQIWFSLDEYKEENKDKNILGELIVFALTQREYILQLDYKEDLEDHVDFIKDFWPDSETKLVQFILENDQNYYAWVPENVEMKNMYEVKIENVDVGEIQ